MKHHLSRVVLAALCAFVANDASAQNVPITEQHVTCPSCTPVINTEILHCNYSFTNSAGIPVDVVAGVQFNLATQSVWAGGMGGEIFGWCHYPSYTAEIAQDGYSGPTTAHTLAQAQADFQHFCNVLARDANQPPFTTSCGHGTNSTVGTNASNGRNGSNGANNTTILGSTTAITGITGTTGTSGTGGTCNNAINAAGKCSVAGNSVSNSASPLAPAAIEKATPGPAVF